ncbi:MAG: efflux RND transporter permease subunit [Candidatus Scalindua rubra]|uniref:Co/Zn/Cd resistance protein CzcA n=1 Tax=Candidatus Scalindua brodae TaxID=237368 RepID=A0A0B0EKY5_9BACT|nr:MAG: Co/Zn/Cd resistance protein CzcA [Candidatus Scalindua brodae]MBZ0108722.1 efflux RND transporter permease subunit [Candidatus Scalindua rubra]TWU31864.1 Cation efflux system protein CusA [Candidatus Brocadiaceae bacterium S225]
MNETRQTSDSTTGDKISFLDKIVLFCLKNKLVVALMMLAIIGWGVMVAPFDWKIGGLPRNPVPVDAIPDIGENQQIVFTEWIGRSPQDVEDQITYPLTVSLLGVPGVKTIRSYSFFGFSSIYIIFNDDIEFYWSRTRVLEKLNSLPAGLLPEGVQPALGPDATALGQVYWYTLEGRDPDGNPIGGWDLNELRTIQDWYVRYFLLAAEGISEVASIGGYVQEYQIDVDPDAMRAARVSLEDVFMAVRMSNIDVGARTIDINKAEYIIRGLGFIEKVSDIEMSVVTVNENIPIYVKNVAKVTLGPALRRGALDKGGAEAAGGSVVVRYGFNPLQSIKNVKKKIEEISSGLPTKAVVDYHMVTRTEIEGFAAAKGFDAFNSVELNQEDWLKWLHTNPRELWPAWINTSHVTVVPFYDRTGLIYETLGTLNTAITAQILVTIIVVLVLVMHLRSSILISALLPIAVLMCFIAMKTFSVDANIVALSGIAIAIGTMVDMGIIMCENILRHLDEADPEEDRLEVIFRATREVSGAVLTAVSTTIVSFLPVFTMIGAEGKLFKPLAFTKTFALFSSVIVALTIIPPAAHILFSARIRSKRLKQFFLSLLVAIGVVIGIWFAWWAGLIIVVMGAYHLSEDYLPSHIRSYGKWVAILAAALLVGIILTTSWLPLGPGKGMLRNLAFVVLLIGGLLVFFQIFQRFLYAPILRWCLDHKILFMIVPLIILVSGISAWMGVDRLFSFLPGTIRNTTVWKSVSDVVPGFGKEFMPPLDEGSYLYMPTTMPHASIGEVLDVLQFQDKQISSIPEVDMAVGKLGRVESPLDPAPLSMIEIIINYKPEYITDKEGHRIKFRFDKNRQEFVRDHDGNLIPDPDGKHYRQWREKIKTPDDIWKEIVDAAQIPGTTSAPKLQPIAARIVMLQSGMRAPMGVKVKGPDLDTIEKVSLNIERFLKEVPSVEAPAVIADRTVGKPYIEIDFDRVAIARYGLTIRQVQDVIEVAIGGRRITTTVEGRERYPVRVRYMRELRDQIEQLGRILVVAPDGAQIPIEQVADINYVRGPQVIKSEDTYLVSYVIFDMKVGQAEVDVVEECQRYLKQKIKSGEFILPFGVSYTFAGSYENQIRSQKTLSIVMPVALFIIFIILYLQFKSAITSSLVFSGILIAWSGGFIMIWLYGQPWFLDFEVFGTNMRDLFQVHTINLSVAVWVGFLALFGIASDDGVVVATYLDQSFLKREIGSREDARKATIVAGLRRVRPCLMTTATTILALIPVLTSTGRGSDIMVPMAIPSFGGMLIAIMTMFIVPVLYCAVMEWKIKHNIKDARFAEHA